MRHRFYLPQPLAPEARVTLAGEEAHHAARVVRVREGEEVELFDGRGVSMFGEVETVNRDEVIVRLTRPVETRRESPLAITLAMAVIQLEKFELALQKATELGVAAIVPVITDRIELRLERFRGKGERWERIVFEAVKQSGRAVIPWLEAPVEFADAIARGGAKVLFDADVEPSPPASSLDAVTLFIGPEGGWSDDELALARQHEVTFARLGPRRLRAETAAIVACTMFALQYGDLR
jgi:16S rRNA (uracil1498-N3)-methyltransferase